MSLVVVNLGLPKTGTTTLARALRLSGLVVADHRLRGRNTGDPDLKGAYVAELLYRGRFDSGDPAAALPQVQAITEMSMLQGDRSLWPQCDFGLILALRAHHPEVKFLASWRDPFALSQSMLAWTNLGTRRLPQAQIPGLPAGRGDTTRERITWIEGHYAALNRFFVNDPDFLTYDVADDGARDRIAAFLGRDLPWWGRLNANPDLPRLKEA